jgi:predicted HTH domain antitoxin
MGAVPACHTPNKSASTDMPSMTLDISVEILTALRRSPDEFVREMRVAAAMHWYQRGAISQERAAEIAGLDRTDFLLALAREKVPAFAVDFDQLREEISRA